MEDIIEQYYAVARDMKSRADNLASTAEYIAGCADRMSEQRMREHDTKLAAERASLGKEVKP
jgi:hypothetical protein